MNKSQINLAEIWMYAFIAMAVVTGLVFGWYMGEASLAADVVSWDDDYRFGRWLVGFVGGAAIFSPIIAIAHVASKSTPIDAEDVY